MDFNQIYKFAQNNYAERRQIHHGYMMKIAPGSTRSYLLVKDEFTPNGVLQRGVRPDGLVLFTGTKRTECELVRNVLNVPDIPQERQHPKLSAR